MVEISKNYFYKKIAKRRYPLIMQYPEGIPFWKKKRNEKVIIMHNDGGGYYSEDILFELKIKEECEREKKKKKNLFSFSPEKK